MVSAARAAVAVSETELGQAESLFENALEAFRTYHLPFEEAETLLAWGRAIHDLDPARAIEKVDGAVEIYTDRGAGKAWIERARAERSRLS